MKNSLNLVLAVLFFIVLGCSCPNMSEIQKTIDNASTSNTPSNTSTPSNTTNTSPGNMSSTGDGSLTLAKYNQISNGMSYREVVGILGSEGVEQMRSGTGKYEVVSYKWEGDNYKFVTVIFMGDKVNSKVQYGLK